MAIKTSPVREDALGIYVICNGGRARPGEVAGYSHVFKMDKGGLKKAIE